MHDRTDGVPKTKVSDRWQLKNKLKCTCKSAAQFARVCSCDLFHQTAILPSSSAEMCFTAAFSVSYQLDHKTTLPMRLTLNHHWLDLFRVIKVGSNHLNRRLMKCHYPLCGAIIWNFNFDWNRQGIKALNSTCTFSSTWWTSRILSLRSSLEFMNVPWMTKFIEFIVWTSWLSRNDCSWTPVVWVSVSLGYLT